MRKWLFAWLGAPVLAIANGGAREALYAESVGDDAAQAISTGTLLGLIGGYMWLLEQKWPLAGRREAVSVGAAWSAMAVAFEFAFGHWVEGESWPDLLANYDVTAGKLWILVPAGLLTGPEAVRLMAARKATPPAASQTG